MTTEAGGPRGGACPWARHSRDPWDAGKKIKGRKRHIITDTGGRLVGAIVHGAEVQRLPRRRPGNRDGAVPLLASIRFGFPWLRHVPRLREGRLLPMPAMPADRLQAPAQRHLPDPEKVRQRLMSLIEKARAAEKMPWSERDARMWQTVFPNMAKRPPDDEAD